MPTASKYENKYLDIARKDLSTAYNFYDITNILEWVFNMSTVAYKEELYSYINKTADTFRNDPNSFSSIWGLICIFRDLPWAITDEFLVKPENKDIQRALLKYENNIDTLINIDNFIVDGNKLFSLDDEKEISELLTKIEPINDKLTEYDIKKK